jgi:aryl-alcohol dehydrogenase-like predicted oxidoreductase/histidinol phosphatase-like enzyme
MRLSTARDRDEERARAVIHAALDVGATLLDTSDAYCHDERDAGHNERLIARALATWSGDPTRITVATKGGIRRPKGAWVTDGRARYLREACDASRRALGVDTIDLYQLHAVDPKTPLDTSIRALAALQREGAIAQIGLCNVTVNQIESARAVAAIASVQVSLSVLDDENLRNGVAEYCRDHSIRLIAYRPLGGERAPKLANDAVLAAIAAKHGVTPQEVALGWLASFGPGVVPIPGATHVETARSIARVVALALGDDDRRALDDRFAGRLLRVPRSERRPAVSAAGDVVLVMGMPGAGKSTVARTLEEQGYERLNRDTLGGSLADLIPRLDRALATGTRRVVLDNTYATRKSRNEVIECAWARGAPVRCIWLATELPDAQINAIVRMIEAHGRLPAPEEIRERGKQDPRYLAPDALFRFERTMEPPTESEGFTSVERRTFSRTPGESEGPRALILDFDDVMSTGDGSPALRATDLGVDPKRRETIARFTADGWLVFAHAWRPQIARGEMTPGDMDACFARTRELLGIDIELACCPHDAGPPICWCRKPLPGTVLDFAIRRGVALGESLVVAHSAADRTMASRLGAPWRDAPAFFGAIVETR